MVAQHVHHADGRKRHGKEVGPLHHAGADEQAAVRTAGDRQLMRSGVFLVDQVFGGRDKVVEHVLLSGKHTRPVPPFPELAAAAQVRHRINAALLHQQHRQRRETRRQIDVETAVSVQVNGILSVPFQALCGAPGTSERAFRPGSRIRAVRRRIPPGKTSPAKSGTARSPGRRIVAVNGRRLRERSVSIKYLGRNVSAAETGYRPNAGQPHLPHRPASQVVLHDGAVRAIEVMREQRPAGHGRRDQLPIGCGQQFGDLRITGAEIHLQQPTVRRSRFVWKIARSSCA